jgi:hypothetical protein
MRRDPMRQKIMQRDERKASVGQSICRMGNGIRTFRRGIQSKVVSVPGIA